MKWFFSLLLPAVVPLVFLGCGYAEHGAKREAAGTELAAAMEDAERHLDKAGAIDPSIEVRLSEAEKSAMVFGDAYTPMLPRLHRLQERVKAKRAADLAKLKQEEERVRAAEQLRQQEEQKRLQAERQRHEEEQQRLANQKAEQVRLAAEKQKAEQQLLADERERTEDKRRTIQEERRARATREKEGRAEAIINGVRDDLLSRIDEDVSHVMHRTHSRQEKVDAGLSVMSVIGHEVLTKLADLHSSNMLEAEHIRKVLDPNGIGMNDNAFRLGAEALVRRYGKFLYRGYTAEWLWREAKIRLDESGLEYTRNWKSLDEHIATWPSPDSTKSQAGRAADSSPAPYPAPVPAPVPAPGPVPYMMTPNASSGPNR